MGCTINGCDHHPRRLGEAIDGQGAKQVLEPHPPLHLSKNTQIPPSHTGKAVVLDTVRNAKLDCIFATPGKRARC